jgi:hypothetical protein
VVAGATALAHTKAGAMLAHSRGLERLGPAPPPPHSAAFPAGLDRPANAARATINSPPGTHKHTLTYQLARARAKAVRER